MMTHSQFSVGCLFLVCIGKMRPEKIKDPKLLVQEVTNCCREGKRAQMQMQIETEYLLLLAITHRFLDMSFLQNLQCGK